MRTQFISGALLSLNAHMLHLYTTRFLQLLITRHSKSEAVYYVFDVFFFLILCSELLSDIDINVSAKHAVLICYPVDEDSVSSHMLVSATR